MGIAGANDFDVDNASRWMIQVTLRDDNGNPLNLTGATARLRVFRDLSVTPVLDVALTTGGTDGWVKWDIAANAIHAALTRAEYRYAVEVKPANDPTQAFTALRGIVNVQRSPSP